MGSWLSYFYSAKNNSANGLKNRILPMLEVTPVDTSRIFQPTRSSCINKNKVNEQIMFSINKWKDVSMENNKTADTDIYYLDLIRHLTSQIKQNSEVYDYNSDDPHNIVTTDEMPDLLQETCKVNYKDTGVMLRKLELGGLVQYRIVGKKRLRHWLIKEEMMYV